jgi:hypothetical protein
MPTHAHVVKGLRCFARGDVPGAAIAWQEGLVDQPGDVQLTELLDSLRAFAPPSAAPPAAAEALVGEPWEGPARHLSCTVNSTGPGLSVLVPVVSASVVSATQMLTLLARLKVLLVLNDFTGALVVAEHILTSAPGYAPALRARSTCQDKLQDMYASRLGDLQGVPKLRIRADELPWLDLDPRAGFVLSQVDGASSFEEIQEIAGIPRLEVLRILSKLLTEKVIGV